MYQTVKATKNHFHWIVWCDSTQRAPSSKYALQQKCSFSRTDQPLKFSKATTNTLRTAPCPENTEPPCTTCVVIRYVDMHYCAVLTEVSVVSCYNTAKTDWIEFSSLRWTFASASECVILPFGPPPAFPFLVVWWSHGVP